MGSVVHFVRELERRDGKEVVGTRRAPASSVDRDRHCRPRAVLDRDIDAGGPVMRDSDRFDLIGILGAPGRRRVPNAGARVDGGFGTDVTERPRSALRFDRCAQAPSIVRARAPSHARPAPARSP